MCSARISASRGRARSRRWISEAQATCGPRPRWPCRVWSTHTSRPGRRTGGADQRDCWDARRSGSEEREMGAAREALDGGAPRRGDPELKPISEGGTWLALQATIWIGIAEIGKATWSFAPDIEPRDRAVSEVRSARHRRLFRDRGDGLQQGNYAKAAEWYRLAFGKIAARGQGGVLSGRCLEETGKTAEPCRSTSGSLRASFRSLRARSSPCRTSIRRWSPSPRRRARTQEAIGYLEGHPPGGAQPPAASRRRGAPQILRGKSR